MVSIPLHCLCEVYAGVLVVDEIKEYVGIMLRVSLSIRLSGAGGGGEGGRREREREGERKA